jgi:hypothetical protein
MKKEKEFVLVKVYEENGDVYMGNNYVEGYAKEMLKLHGYKKYYSGRDSYDMQKTIVGINNKNTIGVEQRRQNGFLYCREYKLK